MSLRVILNNRFAKQTKIAQLAISSDGRLPNQFGLTEQVLAISSDRFLQAAKIISIGYVTEPKFSVMGYGFQILQKGMVQKKYHYIVCISG
jgi:hypothetical protein